jgi:2-amino-4-hydroxy-6-hydroxymethyldihydropteridine diphosphokinase
MRAALGLGSNMGDRSAQLRAAIASLDGVYAVSSFHETDPVGGSPQPRYRNAAVLLKTEVGPRALLRRAQELEAAAGRVRGERWGPRTLDIDLLLCDDLTIDEPGLIIPHPRMTQRAFVLAPLAEIAPDWIVPGTGRRVEDLLADLAVGG